MSKRSWKLLDILNQTSSFFSSREMDNPRLQAELLLADVLDVRRVDLYLQFDRLLTSGEVDAYREHVRQRARRRPLQYITGKAAFRELELAVDEGVLIPRPETEVVVEAVLELLDAKPAGSVLDLGCGSGAIAVSIAFERGCPRVVALDVARDAVRCTRRNAESAGVGPRVQVLQGDLFAPLQMRPDTCGFDIIVSNPPYVCQHDIASLEPEVRDCEPHLALDGGPDGLALYRRIAASAADFLTPGGYLVLELGDGLSADVRALVEACARLAVHDIRMDLTDVPRVLVARRQGG